MSKTVISSRNHATITIGSGQTPLPSYKTSFLYKRNGPNDLNKMISKVYGCMGLWVRESDKYSVKTESR